MRTALIALFACGLLLAQTPAPTAPKAPATSLFINLTTDEPHRANMGIGFGGNQLKRGHGLTIFLNDRAVVLGSTKHTARFPEQQKQLAELLKQGATVYCCPMCMKHYKVDAAELLPGIRVSNPELTGAAIFQDGARTLSW
ncbi:MAG: DsrE family protein [Holophaga sp.]|nr:DsrE family protein [Holophaga sp.]